MLNLKRVTRSVLAIGIVFSLVSCAATPLYRAAPNENAAGYREVLIEPGRYRVVFTGGRGTPASEVQDFALLRAADLTLSKGFSWFRVVSRATVEQDSGRGDRVVVDRDPFCGVYGCRSSIYRGILLAETIDNDRISATLEILLGKGTKPDDPNVYDAKAVADTIRARMK